LNSTNASKNSEQQSVRILKGKLLVRASTSAPNSQTL
jgi:hypothetical protein